MSGGQIDPTRPPTWMREFAQQSRDAYTLKDFQEDCEDWCHITKEDRSRWGPFIYMSIGGTDKMLLRQLPRKSIRDGAHADFGDGQGWVWHEGVEFIFALLWRANPIDAQLECIKVAVHFSSLHRRPMSNLTAWFTDSI